jgi:hypothetical protein
LWYKKVKESRNRPGVAQRVPGGLGSQILMTFSIFTATLCEQRPHYLSRIDHERKIRSRRQRTDIRKYSFVNRTIEDWNQLPAEVLGTLPCKQNTLKKRIRKAIIEAS